MKYCVFIAILCGVLATVKQCDMPTRPTICPALYRPVCGTKTDGFKQTYDNYCSACADVKVVSYEDSQGCNAEPVAPPVSDQGPLIAKPPPPNYTYCRDPRPQICTTDYTPVCGIRKIGEPRTYGNGCGACGDSKVVAWLPGECSTQVNVCAGNEIDCSLIKFAPKPSCGFKPGASYTDTSSTICCIGDTYSQFLRFACPTTPVDPIVDPLPPTTSGKFTMCPEGPRQQGCNKMLQWTCGFKYKGLPQNYGNTCMACADEAVFGYIVGNCSDVVKTCPATRFNCQLTKIVYIYSCAFENGKTPYNVSNNLCCQNSTYSQVITGECPAIKKPTGSTTCPAKQSSFCPEIYKPVCGLLKDSSHKTYPNSCVACADKRVKSYADGQC